MARRRSMYSKKRKINYGRILLLAFLLIAVGASIFILFRKDEYIDVVEDVLNSNIVAISGTVNLISDVDITVYSNNGIRYTNQHENIKRLSNFDGTNSEDLDETGNVKLLFENLTKLKALDLKESLELKKDGYYWIDADFVVENQRLFFSDEEVYNFDLFYDIDNKHVYTKEEYFTEFSNKNNKQKLQGYEATEEFVRLIEELANKNSEN